MRNIVKLSTLPALALLFSAIGAAQATQTVTLDFEGLKDSEGIANYYNGGFGDQGSGPGPNYGITFGSGALSIITQAVGGEGNFDGNPSGTTIAFFLGGSGLVMNVPAGFTSGFSFYYSAASQPGVVTVYDGLNSTGNILATIDLPLTGTPCSGSSYTYSCWAAKGVSFSGVAKSVNFSGTANYIGFDNITLGSQVPTSLTITTQTLANGTVNVAYPSVQFQVSGGKSPYTWSATGLPAGMTLSSTGALSGTPTAAGTFNVAVTVKDSSSPQLSATQNFTLTIIGPLTVTTKSLPNGTVNVAYPSTTLQASGGRTPYNWTASGLPPGLTLAPTGVLSGTPTANGTYSVAVTVYDSATPPASATASLTLVIGAPIPPLSITTTSLPGGMVNAAYPATTLQAQGGTAPYSWTATGLPAGLSLSSAGVLSGTPTAGPGTFNVSVTVTDSGATRLTATTSLSLVIAAAVQPLTLSCTAPPSVTSGSAYTATCTASGGVQPLTFSATGLPSWLSETSPGTYSGTAPATPSLLSFTVTVSDSATPQQTKSQTITSVVVTPLGGVTITQNSSGSVPNQTTLQVAFGQAATTAYTGSLALSFKPDASVTNVPATYVDPAGGFPATGQSTTLTTNFTINQGQTQASITFGQGTVAGTWTVTLTSLQAGGVSQLPLPAPSYTVAVAPGAPAITAGSVKIVNATSSGFAVQLSGYTTTRDVTSATFNFTAASGAQLQSTSVTVPFNGLDQSQWFNTDAGRSAGGTFSLSLPFGYSGDPSALGTVSVTLTGSRGTSTAVTGGK